MQISIYHRIPSLPTASLRRLVRVWNRSILERHGTPRNDYHGRCLYSAVLELERRGCSPPPRTLCETSQDAV